MGWYLNGGECDALEVGNLRVLEHLGNCLSALDVKNVVLKAAMRKEK